MRIIGAGQAGPPLSVRLPNSDMKVALIVGGSYIGLEFAQMYRRFGARVTVVEKATRLVPKEDPIFQMPSKIFCRKKELLSN